jgi:hypothetical protein
VIAFPCKFTAPAPDNVAISSLLANFSVPLAFTVTAVGFNKAAPPLNVRVPASTTTPPTNVFVPLSANSPNPAFVNKPLPPNTPLSTTPLGAVNVVAPVSVPEPLIVITPVLVTCPKVTADPSE